MARLRLKILTTRLISYIPPLPPSKTIAYHVLEYWGFYGIIVGSGVALAINSRNPDFFVDRQTRQNKPRDAGDTENIKIWCRNRGIKLREPVKRPDFLPPMPEPGSAVAERSLVLYDPNSHSLIRKPK